MDYVQPYDKINELISFLENHMVSDTISEISHYYNEDYFDSDSSGFGVDYFKNIFHFNPIEVFLSNNMNINFYRPEIIIKYINNVLDCIDKIFVVPYEEYQQWLFDTNPDKTGFYFNSYNFISEFKYLIDKWIHDSFLNSQSFSDEYFSHFKVLNRYIPLSSFYDTHSSLFFCPEFLIAYKRLQNKVEEFFYECKAKYIYFNNVSEFIEFFFYYNKNNNYFSNLSSAMFTSTFIKDYTFNPYIYMFVYYWQQATGE